MRGILNLVLIFNAIFCVSIAFLFVFVIYATSMNKFSSIKGLEYNQAIIQGKHVLGNKVVIKDQPKAVVDIPTKFGCNPIKENHEWNPFVTLEGVKYPKLVPSFLNESINFDCLNQYGMNQVKRMLLWNNHDDYYRYGFGVKQPFITGRCPVVNCEITNDKSRVSSVDVVVVYLNQELNTRNLPPSRSSSVRWILYNDRPLTVARPDLKDLFNASIDYSFARSTFAPIYYANSPYTWHKAMQSSKL